MEHLDHPSHPFQWCQNGAFLLLRSFIIALGGKGVNWSFLFCPRLKQKTPWKCTNLQKMNVCQILNVNLNFRNLRKPLTRKSTRKRINIDFEMVSIVCALARLTKIGNVWFCSRDFSYAIQETYTALRGNSTLNFTRKTDIPIVASRFVRYRFFARNVTWNSLVRQWIFL